MCNINFHNGKSIYTVTQTYFFLLKPNIFFQSLHSSHPSFLATSKILAAYLLKTSFILDIKEGLKRDLLMDLNYN